MAAVVDTLREIRETCRLMAKALMRWLADRYGGFGFAAGLLCLGAITAGALSEGCPDPRRAVGAPCPPGNEAAVEAAARRQAEQAAIAVRRRAEEAVRAVPREGSPSRQGGAEEPPAPQSLLAVALLSGSAGLFLGLLVSLVMLPATGFHRGRSRTAERAFARQGKVTKENREAAR